MGWGRGTSGNGVLERAERGRGKMGWTLIPLLKKTTTEEGEGENEEMPDSSPQTIKKSKRQIQSAPHPPRVRAHVRASRARVDPAPAPPAVEAILSTSAEFYFIEGVTCVFFSCCIFSPRFLSPLSTFLWKEELLACSF